MNDNLSCAVIGDKSSVFGFIAVGFNVFFADDAVSCESIISRLINSKEYAVIYLTEQLAENMGDKLDEYKALAIPAIIPIPDRTNSGYGIKNIKKSVERAIGSDILFKDK